MANTNLQRDLLSNAATATFLVAVKDINVYQLPDVGWHSGRFYVKLVLDGTTKQTAVVTVSSGNTASWTETIYFDALGSSILKCQLFAKHRIRHDELVGRTKGNVASLLEEGANEAVTHELSTYDANGTQHKTGILVKFTIARYASSCSAAQMQVNEAVAQGKDSFAQMTSTSRALVPLMKGAFEVSTTIMNSIPSITSNWAPLLEKIKLFTEIVDKISEIHPYAKMAWSILSATHKIILAQRDRDAAVSHLVKAMDDIFSFVHEAEPVSKIKSHQEIIVIMTKQTTECAYFIRDYAMDKSFGKRILRNSFMSDADSRIKLYEGKFKELKSAFQERAVLQTELTVMRLMSNLEDLATEVGLNDIPYAEGARFNTKQGCLPGTRREIIDEIIEWVNQPNGETEARVLFLSGVAGSGKSAIAHTVASYFEQLKRLGSSYCFDRADQAKRCPENLFSTIALDLADLDPQWKRSLSQVVQGKRAIRTSRSPSEQFETLILQSANALATTGPIVVVIDGFDESGDRAARRPLLDIIAKKAFNLPPNFRLIVTARPEPDILDALDNGSKYIFTKHMASINKASNDRDISTFIETQLSGIPSLESEWPNKTWCRLLLERSGRLFQWAFTACLAIKDGDYGLHPTERFRRVLSSTRGLDGLYSEILSQAINSHDPLIMSRFKLIMGRILAAREPLSVSAHAKLYSQDDAAGFLKIILRPLGSLLSGCTQESVPLRPLHTSFFDFLKDESRSKLYYVDSSQHNRSLTLLSLRTMKSGLKFNICNLNTSHLRNVDIPGLATHVEAAILPHLAYACRFWADHLSATVYDPEILGELWDFMYNRLLFWLEALSLIKHVSIASRMLSSILRWSQNKDKDIVLFATDAIKFVAAFGHPISQSAPHIYLSALPFAPKRSHIAAHFLPKFPKILSLTTGKAEDWPAIINVLEGHSGPVVSVAFSPDGKRIVSGSRDQTIWVWDAEMGDVVSGPLRGHSSFVLSVSFSSDSKRIVSGSADKTIRVWDAETGDTASGPFEGHATSVFSVAFSPDSKHIVSGSQDGEARIWDADTGNVIRLLAGHTDSISSVVFSSDGKFVASGSFDKTIRIWNARTGRMFSGPFKQHTDSVESVAFSPDGMRIVSGSSDMTVRVWDARTGNVVLGPLEGHTDVVISVSFSSDGKRIVSGSWDKTIRVWDAETGRITCGPFEGHTDSVFSVAFSPDSKRIISGSGDKTLRVWDAETGDINSGLFKGHTNSVYSVAFSPDNKRIVSGSKDKAIWIWDAETGDVVSGPFNGHVGPVLSVAFSPEGKHIASGSQDATIRVWDAETGDMISGPFEKHHDAVESVAFSPDSMRLVSGSSDKTILVWDVETGEIVLGPLEFHTDSVFSVSFSPDSKRIVSGSSDTTILVWDVKTGDVVLGPLEMHLEPVFSVAFSPDGKRIISGSMDKTILVWNAETGDMIAGPFEGHIDWIFSVTFSPDGKRIASGSGLGDPTIRICDAETGDTVAGPLEGHTGPIYSVAFSSDGKRLVSSSQDRTIRVWAVEINGSRSNQSSDGNNNLIESDVFPPDGQYLASTSYDSTSRVLSNQGNNSGDGFGDSSKLEGGWILNSASRLLFWVPPWSRTGLWRPRNTAIIGDLVTKLDLTHFMHGDTWQQCIQ